MRDKPTANNHSEQLINVTWNIITDKSANMISCISTHRTPSANEVKRSDWNLTMRRGNLRIHVIGRGDELSRVYLRQLASAYCDGLPVWKSVDLTNMENPVEDMFKSADWEELMKMAVKI